MKAKYLFTGLAATSLFIASCKDTTSNVSASNTTEEVTADTPETAPDPTPAPPAGPETTIAKELDGKAHLMVDGEYQETQIKNADYYLVYFTASW